ncbi:MAG: HD-GYP domain-containing protein, partial [Candidatus Woesearchaeota archaeon]
LIIVDELAFNENESKILYSKESDCSFSPLMLLTNSNPNKLPEKWLKIVDEIIKIPVDKHILSTRIENLLNLKLYQEKIKYFRFHDQLTDLFNRDYFMEELERLDTKRQYPLALIMGDVNGLKFVNDAFGHDKGDYLLKEIANILKNNLREEDIVARIGGDEFGILLPETTEEKTKEIIERINNNCKEAEFDYLEISIALGYCVKKTEKENINEVFIAADNNMYENKISEEKRKKENIIKSLKNRLFKKSNESEEHLIRMKNIALEFSEELDLDEKDKEKLNLLIEFHDLGKIIIAEEILKKKDKLTKKEYEKVKEHSEFGYRILEALEKYSFISQEVLSHHERWDGKGYPNSLKKEEIPKIARIFAIIEAYEVMTSVRPYKKKISKKEAILEIKEKAGSQFDTDLAKKFCNFIN